MGFAGGEDAHNFKISGPKLPDPNWEKPEHCRAIVACLVHSVYVHRQDIKKQRPVKLAPPWWESFSFELKHVFKDASKVFGAIFEFNPQVPHLKAPRFVVAFRGTQSILDLGLDLLLLVERLQENKRVQKAMDTVINLASDHPSRDDGGRCGRNIWLAGHSLGASIATFVGLCAAEKKGFLFETFLFNPPYFRLDPCTLVFEEVKNWVMGFQEFVWKLFGPVMTETSADEEEENRVVNQWVPNLFLNPDDFLCKGFIKYFENQHLFKGMKSGNFVRYRDGGRTYDLNTSFANVDQNSVYLLPSGRLTINGDPAKLNKMRSIRGSKFFEFIKNGELKEAHQLLKRWKNDKKKAHRLQQWWKDDQKLVCREYVKGGGKRELMT